MSKESPVNEVVKGVALTCAKLELTFGYHGNELTYEVFYWFEADTDAKKLSKPQPFA